MASEKLRICMNEPFSALGSDANARVTGAVKRVALNRVRVDAKLDRI